MHSPRRRWPLLLSSVLLVPLIWQMPCALAVSADDGSVVRLVVRSRPGLAPERGRGLTRARAARVRREIPAIATEVIEVPRGSADQIVSDLRASGAFTFVEKDGLVSASATVNDPFFSEQWGALRINVAQSWDTTQGETVVVAVVDSGVDASHPELVGQLLPGWDFVNDDADPADDSGHGTAMAGIIAAAAGNGLGLAGISPASTLLPVKVLDASDFGFFSDVAAGIVYAVDNGADVINLSLGASAGSSILQAAVDYARAHDVIVVAAAGNDAHSDPEYPAACAGAVAVAATDASDHQAWFSNYGSWITLAAPGLNIYATAFNPAYTSVTGTSPAAAITSGAFALLRSANPQMTAAAAIERMTANAADLGPKGWDPQFGFGLVDAYAALFPAGPAAANDRSKPVVTLQSPTKSSLVDGLVAVEVAATDNVGIARVDLQVDGEIYASADLGPYVFAWDTTGLEAGMHSLRAYAYDSAGNYARTRPVRVYVTPGEGLLVQRAKIKPGTNDDGKVTWKAMVRLPQGFDFDAATHAVSLSLNGNAEVLAMQIDPGAMQTRRTTAKYRGLVETPAGGNVRLVIKPNRLGGTYSLQIAGRGLSLTDTAEEMELTIVVGGNLVHQPLLLRASRGDLVIP